jgi:Ribosomal protein S21e
MHPLWIQDRLITSKDHASVQVVIADVDANGRALPSSTSFALSGQVRAQGEGDDSLNRLATKSGCKLEVCRAPGDEIGINGAYPRLFFQYCVTFGVTKSETHFSIGVYSGVV